MSKSDLHSYHVRIKYTKSKGRRICIFIRMKRESQLERICTSMCEVLYVVYGMELCTDACGLPRSRSAQKKE